jgi:SAM-dependent methyltransferase
MAQRKNELERIELTVREVYDFCPPTFARYTDDGWAQYARQWEWFIGQLGLSRGEFAGKELLDAGCGSCEKACFYHDWGANVTGLEMTGAVIDRAREVVGNRSIRLVRGSILSASFSRQFDIVVSDGVLHHTADTFAALTKCVQMLKPGGVLVLGLVNVWGSFWWFGVARTLVGLLGAGNFHRRARWGRRLFGWTRKRHEWTQEGDAFYRGVESWSYDWFANPRWNRHSPREIAGWLEMLGLEELTSVPPLREKKDPRTWPAKLVRAISGSGTTGIGWYWLLNREPNMLYVCARKRSAQSGV